MEHEVEELARLYGVQTSYVNAMGETRRVGTEPLFEVLRALGADVRSMEGVSEALRARRNQLAARPMAPVIVVWDGRESGFELRLTREAANGNYRLEVALEGGHPRTSEGELAHLPVVREEHVDGQHFLTRRVPIPAGLETGYGEVSLELGGEVHHARLLSAPTSLPHAQGRAWGVFAPTYALRSETPSGIGSFADFEGWIDYVGSRGGGLFGTLPVLASFLDEAIFEPSPYAPASRLFWNELFLDLHAVPELEHASFARELLGRSDRGAQLASLAASETVDYRAVVALQRPVLQALADACFSTPSLRDAIERFATANPRAVDYARFRGAVDEQNASFHVWPERLKNGELAPGDYGQSSYRYHLYAQMRTAEQLASLSSKARRYGPGLYLDLPLGVHPDGYDVWRERGCFLASTSAGAPPDDFFSLGQDWGFPPFHPEGIREDGYRYVAECFRSQLRHAGVLRIDHVMWLHRLFCVPHGRKAVDGMYVRYHPEELYAVLSIEAHRHASIIVGEDLGTVPDEVREGMGRHGVLRMYVLQFEAQPGWVKEPPRDAIACVNTHDLPTFTAFWNERDVEDRIAMGLLDEGQVAGERHRRGELREALRRYRRNPHDPLPPDAGTVLRSALENLADSEAELLLVNVEDLWCEEKPQNVPGTGAERPNWRRRLAHPIESWKEMPEVDGALTRIQARRRSGT